MAQERYITPGQVEHIAHLARIQLREGDREKFAKQLEDIFKYVNTLQKVDTSDIDPTFQVAPSFNVFRPDEVKDSMTAEQALANAPDSEDGYFKVPPILTGESG